jgi:hypothetical protein
MPKDFRGTKETNEAPWLWLFYEYEPKDGKAFVKYRTTLELSEKDEEQMEEIEKHRRAMRRQARILRKFARRHPGKHPTNSEWSKKLLLSRIKSQRSSSAAIIPTTLNKSSSARIHNIYISIVFSLPDLLLAVEAH